MIVATFKFWFVTDVVLSCQNVVLSYKMHEFLCEKNYTWNELMTRLICCFLGALCNLRWFGLHVLLALMYLLV